MCGINGIIRYHNQAAPIDRAAFLKVRDAMAARGPDGKGQWFSDQAEIALGHRRLAIIDLHDRAAQPMHDGALHIVFNGEIYNYKTLRRALQLKGHRFQTDSDTEVLLKLYREEGENALPLLRGMFAFAIWDDEKKQLLIARDAYGIKPLYYSDNGNSLRFSSELKALIADDQVSQTIDAAGLCSFLIWGSVSEPFTLYEQVKLLPVGHVLTVSNEKGVQVKPWFDLDKCLLESYQSSLDFTSEQAQQVATTALKDSIQAHHIADVEVGVFLSAGLDSSTVVGLSRELRHKADIQTVTLSFEEFQGRAVDEAPMAAEIAKHFGVNNHCHILAMSDVEAMMQDYLIAMDQPTIDGLNTWIVSKATHDLGLKVVLSGLGGDELLGGYSSFQQIPEMMRRWAGFQSWPRLSKAWRIVNDQYLRPFIKAPPKHAALAELGGDISGAYLLQRGVFMPWELSRILPQDWVTEGLAKLDAWQNLQQQKRTESLNHISHAHHRQFAWLISLESSRYMRNQLLRDSDWIGMAHSLEIRVPLVDRVLCEKLAGLAIAQKLPENKGILPLSLEKPLPDAVINRPKTGFTLPIWRWLRQSPQLDSWKRCRFLHHQGVHDYQRWAYSILHHLKGTGDLLK